MNVNTTMWKYIVDKYLRDLAKYRDKHGYKDLYIISKDGDIMYSITNGPELGQNLMSGELKNSPLDKCFQGALGGVTITDFEPYAPQGNKPAAFIGAPVLEDGSPIGAAILQLSIEPLNEIVQRRNGMGKNGEKPILRVKITARPDFAVI